MPKAIADVAEQLGVASEHVLPWGPDKDDLLEMDDIASPSKSMWSVQKGRLAVSWR